MAASESAGFNVRAHLQAGHVIPAHPLALTPARDMDERHQQALTRYYVAAGAGGMAVEFFPEPKRVGQQLKLAAKRGCPAALVIGSDEFRAGTAQFKNLRTEQGIVIDWHGDLQVLVDAVHSQCAAMRAG